MRWFLCCVLLLVGCAEIQIHPTPQNKYMACRVTCGHGKYTFPEQHQCRGSRWFTPIWINGEYVERGADGMKTLDLWTTETDGDIPKEEVVIMSCESYKKQQQDSRAITQQGQYPGEDKYGNTKPDGRDN